MKIQSEEMLLNQEIRAALIEGFCSQKNELRKKKAHKAYDCLNDKTIKYVIEQLCQSFSEETVEEMKGNVTNISILRKVVDKLAKVYANGISRSMPTTEQTMLVEEMAEYLSMDEHMKKGNRYIKAMKNALAYVRPVPNADGKLELKLDIKAPFHYDVVPFALNPTIPLAIVLSDYIPKPPEFYKIGDAAARDGEGIARQVYVPEEDQKKEYIWWTKNFHFTTNAKGEIISPSMENPILTLPFVNLSQGQDEQFFVDAGDDLTDAGININVQISNMIHIGNTQGHGQLYMTGKNLPKSIKVGVNHCVQIEQNEGEPTPNIGYLNSGAELAELRSNVEMLMAMMLTTNNLSTSGFSTSLTGGKEFASGIALMIDKSESIEDVNEQSQTFIKAEPQIFGKVQRWQEVYKETGLLAEEAQEYLLPTTVEEELVVTFPSVKPVMSEAELLDIYQKRLDMGLNTRVDILRRDNPGMGIEDAIAKIAEIDAEKQAKMAAFQLGESEDESNGSDGEQLEDNGEAGPVRGGKTSDGSEAEDSE